MKNIVRLFAVAILMPRFSGSAVMAAQELSPDAQGIDQLAKSGSDLTKLHEIVFTLVFPAEKAAERAELELTGFAFATKVEQGKTAGQWILRGTKKMYPLESDLSGLRDKLNAIAAEGKGTYEGWKAKALPAASR